MAETIERVSGAGLTWEELCKDPSLQDLPYKIETNERGQIVMSPTQQYHGAFQAEIAGRLGREEGRVVTECAVNTSKGTKVADVGWYTLERWENVKNTFDTPVAPEICVEVLSPTNTNEEIEEKKQLYFERGAEEVWTCDPEGRMRFFDTDGPLDASRRVSAFPQHIEI